MIATMVQGGEVRLASTQRGARSQRAPRCVEAKRSHGWVATNGSIGPAGRTNP